MIQGYQLTTHVTNIEGRLLLGRLLLTEGTIFLNTGHYSSSFFSPDTIQLKKTHKINYQIWAG